jgi:hypothetical protein
MFAHAADAVDASSAGSNEPGDPAERAEYGGLPPGSPSKRAGYPTEFPPVRHHYMIGTKPIIAGIAAGAIVAAILTSGCSHGSITASTATSIPPAPAKTVTAPIVQASPEEVAAAKTRHDNMMSNQSNYWYRHGYDSDRTRNASGTRSKDSSTEVKPK